MTAAEQQFQDVTAEGPFGHKLHRDDPIRAHFDGFDALTPEQKARVLRVRDGEEQEWLLRLPGEEILFQHAGIEWYDGATRNSWGYHVRRRRVEPAAPTFEVKPPPTTTKGLPVDTLQEKLLRLQQDLTRATDERDRLRHDLGEAARQVIEAREAAEQSASEVGRARQETAALLTELTEAKAALQAARAAAGSKDQAEQDALAGLRQQVEDDRKALDRRAAELAALEARLAQLQLGVKADAQDLAETQRLLKAEEKRLAVEKERQRLEAARLAGWEAELAEREKADEGKVVFDFEKERRARPALEWPAASAERGAIARVVTIWFLVFLLIGQCIYLATHLS